MKKQQNLNQIKIGTILSVNYGLYSHKGLYAGVDREGEDSVIEFSAASKGFNICTLNQFANGKSVIVDGYLGNLSSDEVINRTLEWTSLPYRLFSRNCEHFVRHAHGVTVQSPQIQQGVLLCIAFIIFKSNAKEI